MKKRTLIAGIVGVFALAIGTFVVTRVYDTKADSPSERSSSDVINFTVESAAVDNPKIKVESEATFSQDYFSKPSTEYNNDLAILSLQMAMTASSTAESYAKYGEKFTDVAYTDYDDPDPTTARNVYLVNTYKNMEFVDDVYYKYDKPLNDTSDTVAYGIASRKIKVNGKRYNLVNVAIRSASYGAEWASNYTVSNENGVTGFEDAANDVYNGLKEYLEDEHLNKSNTKIWISGFSRGAGVANIAAASIDKACRDKLFKMSRDDVYAYTFATPQGVYDNEVNDIHNELYDNILNVINRVDIVAKTAPSCWGYGRYGKVLYIDQKHISGDDLDKIKEGKKVNYDSETVELVKNISKSYDEMRFINDSENEDKGKMYGGFAVKEEFTDVLDIAFQIIAKDTDEYKDKWQDVVTDIVPFAIDQVKKYDEETGTWVNYESLGEFIEMNYDADVINKAAEADVFSQSEYRDRMDMVDKMYRKGVLDESKTKIMTKIIDTYYGIRILAYHYGISKDDVLDVTGRAFDKVWDLLNKCLPIGDTLNFKMNHYCEFYLAWLKNYDISSNTVISK